jgi:hypothetical protein
MRSGKINIPSGKWRILVAAILLIVLFSTHLFTGILFYAVLAAAILLLV